MKVYELIATLQQFDPQLEIKLSVQTEYDVESGFLQDIHPGHSEVGVLLLLA